VVWLRAVCVMWILGVRSRVVGLVVVCVVMRLGIERVVAVVADAAGPRVVVVVVVACGIGNVLYRILRAVSRAPGRVGMEADARTLGCRGRRSPDAAAGLGPMGISSGPGDAYRSSSW
jgi:hypothetical protein